MPKFFSGFGVFTNLAWTDSEILSNRNNPESEGKTFPRVPTGGPNASSTTRLLIAGL